MNARLHAVSRSFIAGALLVVVTAGPAAASPDTLRMAFEDITMGMADVVASPVTAGMGTADNLEAVSDNALLQALYVVPGWLGLTVLGAGQGTLRVLVGVVELVPGLVLFPFPDTDIPEDFNVFRQGALVDVSNPLAENPAWLPYVLPITPVTMDVRVFTLSPLARYLTPADDTAAGDPAAWASNP